MADPHLIPHDARAVANTFLDRASDAGVPLDPLQVQNLVYIAHGWHLAVTDRPLFFQTVFAWPYGPVVKPVVRAFREYGRGPVDGRAAFYNPDRGEWEPYTADYAADTADVIDRVWDTHKRFSGVELSAIAFDKGTPWHRLVGHLPPREVRNVPIPNELIRQYYVSFARQNEKRRAAALSNPA